MKIETMLLRHVTLIVDSEEREPIMEFESSLKISVGDIIWLNDGDVDKKIGRKYFEHGMVAIVHEVDIFIDSSRILQHVEIKPRL